MDSSTKDTREQGWAAFAADRTSHVPGTALIAKAFALVDAVGAAPGLVSVPDLARQLGWPRATLYRILAAVTAQGYLRFDPVGGGYTLGYRFLDLAQNVWAASDLAAVASAELRRLRDMTGETAYLAVRQGDAVLGIGKFESPHSVRSAAELGLHKPLHCTSQGKAILAFLPGAEALCRRLELTRFTPFTITDPDALVAELAAVRQRGFAIEHEEIVPGQRCVGAPVLNGEGRPVAAISVAAPNWRLTRGRADQLGPEIARIGLAIGTLLRGPARPAPGADTAIRRLSAEPAFYGSDPLWDEAASTCRWVDRLAPCLHLTSPEGSTVLRPAMDAAVGAAALDGPMPVLSIGRHLLRLDLDDGETRVSDHPPVTALAHDGAGRLWCASPEGSGSRIAPVGGAEAGWSVAGGVSALAWSLHEKVFYASDGESGAIYRLEPRGRVRVLARLPGVSGQPRALAFDPAGRLWAALHDGWSLTRLDTDGEPDRVVALPVPRPTGLTFTAAGAAIVTTARIDLALELLERAPLSGHLLAMDGLL